MPDGTTTSKSKVKPTSRSAADGQEQAREVISILYEISTLLVSRIFLCFDGEYRYTKHIVQDDCNMG